MSILITIIITIITIILCRVSRKFRMGLTLFWGYLGLPIPFVPPHGVCMCIADPIPVTRYIPPQGSGGAAAAAVAAADPDGRVLVPDELIDELLNKVNTHTHIHCSPNI